MTRSPAITLLAALGLLTGCVNADDSHPRDSQKADKSEQTSDDDESHSVNGSVHVRANEKRDEVSTVNGSIHIDESATVASAQTVNGSITLGNHATAESTHTVNGGITLGEGAHVLHLVSAVNGSLVLHRGADVAGALTNVNGHITLEGAHVGGGINTVSGDISIGGDSHVEGGILVEKDSNEIFGFFHWGSSKVPRIVIGPGTVVKGELRFKRPVRLLVSDSATIGPVSGATAVTFSGMAPEK